MRISDIKGIRELDPNVSRAGVALKQPSDEVSFSMIAGRVIDEDVQRLNQLGCRVGFYSSFPYPVCCRAKLEVVPQVLTEDFIREARIQEVVFR